MPKAKTGHTDNQAFLCEIVKCAHTLNKTQSNSTGSTSVPQGHWENVDSKTHSLNDIHEVFHRTLAEGNTGHTVLK